MKKLLNWMKKNEEIVFKSIYSIPIFLSIIVSINHCYTWFLISNENIWAWYVSISIEVVALTTLVALILGRITPSILFTFILITTIQILGNVFYSFNYIVEDGNLFQSWKKLVDIIFEDNELTIDKYKFWLATIQGSIVPMLSLLSLHLISNFKLKEKKINEQHKEEIIKEVIVEKPIEVVKEVIKEVEVPVEVIKEIEKEIIVEKPIEVIVEKPIEVIKEVPIVEEIKKIILPMRKKTIEPVVEIVQDESTNEDDQQVFYEDMGKQPEIVNKPRKSFLPKIKISNKK
jgi:hypothetical protein